MAGESKKTIYAALGANGAIAVAKAIGGLVTGSSALLAEAAHSVADTTNQVFLLVSLSLGKKPPDEENPFGHGKERFFWAFLVAVLMFVAGGVFSIGEGALALVGGEEESSGLFFVVAYSVLGFSLAVETYAWYRAMRQLRGEARKEGRPFLEHVRRSKDPTVKVVFFEDSAAVAGVLIALGGVALAQVTGSHVWDGIAAVLIGILLMGVAFQLGRDTKGLLIGEAASAEDRRVLRETIEADPAVVRVVELLTMHVGPESILVAARVDLDAGADGNRLEQVSEQLARRMREAVPTVGFVFLDPTAPSAGPEHAPG